MKKILITDKTTQETYDQILLMQEAGEIFELHTSCISTDTITKIIGFGAPIFVDMSPRDPKKEYDTIRELNMHDSDMVIVAMQFAKHTRDFVYSVITDFADDPNLNASLILFDDIGEPLDTCCWNNLIICCLDHDLHIATPADRMDKYHESIS